MGDFRTRNGKAVTGGYEIEPKPIAIAANTDDLDIRDSDVAQSLIKLTNATGGSLNITGATASNEGHFVILYNAESSTGDIVLKHIDAGSDALNRFVMQSAADVTLAAGQKRVFYYLDGAWRD